MSLFAALQHQREQGVRKGPDCRLCVLMRSLSGPDAQALTDAMADESLTMEGISRALRAEGYDIASGVVGRHRKGECRGR